MPNTLELWFTPSMQILSDKRKELMRLAKKFPKSKVS